MRKIVNNRFAIRIMAAVVCLAVFPTWLHGQDVEKKEAPKWTDKQLKKAGEHLNEINEWQKAIDDYEQEEKIFQDLEKDKKNKRIQLNELLKHLKESQKQLQSMRPDKKERDWFQQMFKQYDTTLLLQAQGRIGDDELEMVVKDLLVCHRAEALLFIPYNANRVEKVCEELESVDKKRQAGLNIVSRLEQYKEVTDNLRDILDKANKSVNPQSDKNDAPANKNNYRKAFFDEIERGLSNNPTLLNPDDYPYLYGKLMEALKVKMDEPSNATGNVINKIINEL